MIEKIKHGVIAVILAPLIIGAWMIIPLILTILPVIFLTLVIYFILQEEYSKSK